MNNHPQTVSIDPATSLPDPSSLANAPLVVDTDVGGDPDDAFALAAAALTSEHRLALVTTTDERDGQCARFARHLLDLLGRPDVPVAAGRPLDPPRRLYVGDLIPDTVPTQPTNVTAAVAAVLEQTHGQVRWAGCGPMTNLAQILREHPGWAQRLVITQMGGAFRYRHPDRGEYNFRRDVPAVRTVLATVQRPTLVVSDLTFTPELLVTPTTPLYRLLTAPQAPGWARLLCSSLQLWIADGGRHGSRMHDPLTLSAAMGLPFVRMARERVAVDQLGRMRPDPAGAEVFYSHTADFAAFRRWLTDALAAPVTTPAAPGHSVGPLEPDVSGSDVER